MLSFIYFFFLLLLFIYLSLNIIFVYKVFQGTTINDAYNITIIFHRIDELSSFKKWKIL